MRRVWLALMGAAQKAYLEAGANRNTDPCDCDDSEPDPRMASLKGLFGAGGETDRPS